MLWKVTRSDWYLKLKYWCLFQTEAHIDTLTSEQAAYILNRVGLTYLYNSVQQQVEIQVHVPLKFLLSEIIVHSLMKMQTKLNMMYSD